MKKVAVLLLVTLLLVLPGCVSYDEKSPQHHPKTRWVAEEIDMWFVVDSHHKARGEMTIKGEIIPFYVSFWGSVLFVRPISDYNYKNPQYNEMYYNFLRTTCEFYEDYFTMKIDSEYLDFLGEENEIITFVRDISFDGLPPKPNNTEEPA